MTTTRPVVPAVFHLRRARDLIDRHFAEPLDLDAMAAAAGFSRYHFARGFRAAYGEPPRAYLTRRRVERAQDLLRSANLTVTEICQLVGFASLGSFSARFTELVGCSPTQYRRHHVERGGPPPVPGCFLMAWSRPLPARRAQARRSRATGRAPREIILADAAMGHDPQTAEQIRELVAKGAMGSGVMATDDCRKTYEELSACGVVFTQEPAERPYGIEAVFRDDSGNWFSLTQATALDGP